MPKLVSLNSIFLGQVRQLRKKEKNKAILPFSIKESTYDWLRQHTESFSALKEC